MMSSWCRCFVYTMSFCLLASCLPVQQQNQAPSKAKRSVEEIGEGGNLFEGDIKLSVQDRKKRLVMQDEPLAKESVSVNLSQYSGTLWPDNTIYFKFLHGMNFGIKQKFLKAIGIWEKHTCIQFKTATANTTAYLLLVDTEGCSSFVGRTGKEQNVSISSSCSSIGHALHELGHAIGLWHEHTRIDRDKYIKIIWENIKGFAKSNYQSYKHPNISVGYDFESIMHYAETAFAKDKKKPTIEVIYKPLPSCITKVGQRYDLSYKDKLRVNILYGCKAELDKTGADPCPLPPPLPTTTAITPTPSPTVTTSSTKLPAPTPTCTVQKAFKSDTKTTTQILISFSDTNFWSIGCFGDSYCQKDNCSASSLSHYNECKEQYFVMYLSSNRKNRFIRNGDTIALRSSKRSNYWMDCSRGNCTLSQCADNPKSITNYTRDICSQHKLQIFALSESKRIQTTNLIYFKGLGSDKYLNCYGKRCKLISESSDCDEDEYSGASGSLCNRQLFKLKKHKKDCL